MKVYLSGPMTGLLNDNHPEFNRVAALLRAAGHEVVNPADLNPPGTSWVKCMKVDIAAMLTCEAVATLLGVDGSRGGRIETRLARDLDMHVAHYETYLTAEVTR